MPHVIVKLWPGKSEASKQALSRAIVEAVAKCLDYSEDSVSLAMEEVAPGDWTAQVYDPDILGKWDLLTKQPGYGPMPKAQRKPT